MTTAGAISGIPDIAVAITWLIPVSVTDLLRVTGVRVRYFALSFAFGCEAAGCGRRNGVATGAGFWAAFGFLGSRLPRLRPLAKAVLPVVWTAIRPGGLPIGFRGAFYGVFFSALWVIA